MDFNRQPWMIDNSKVSPPLWIRYLAPIYHNFYNARRCKFLKNRENVGAIPIISIGSISLGGSGKTPLLNLLLNDISGLNLSTSVIVKSTGSNTVNPALDEARLIAKYNNQTKIVPVNNKIVAIKLLNTNGIQPDLIIIDDGFQLFSLNKLEIVVARSSELLHPSLVVPLGYAREDIDALKRADYLIIRCEKTDSSLEQLVSERYQNLPIYYVKDDVSNIVEISSWINSNKNQQQAKIDHSMIDHIKASSKILLWAGTARPEKIADVLIRKYGFEIDILPTLDHDPNFDKLMNSLSNNQPVLITEKDACRFESRFKLLDKSQLVNLFVIIHRLCWLGESPSIKFYKEARQLYETASV